MSPRPVVQDQSHPRRRNRRKSSSSLACDKARPMTFARDLIVDKIPRVQGTQEHLASWYTQGLSDGLGDRLLMFDNTNAPSWELLRFRPEFATAVGFELALRERVEQLREFRHASFTTVRSVEALGAGDGL